MTTPNYPYGEPHDPQPQGNIPNYDSYSGNYSGGAGEAPQINGSAYAGGFENSPLNVGENKTAKWALGLGIVSVVLLLSVLAGPLGFLVLLAPLVAIAGLIVAIVALVKARKFTGTEKRRGFAISGLILSLLTLAIVIIFTLIVTVLVSNSGVLDCFSGQYGDAASQQACVEETLNTAF